MPYYLYTPESFPNEELAGKPGYTPEFLAHAGVQLPALKAKEWVKLPDTYRTFRHRDFMDKRGTDSLVSTETIVGALRNRFTERGVIFLDHQPSEGEKQKCAEEAEKANMAFRMKCVEWYESQVREKEVTGFGRTTPTPYEDQCYTLLGLTKPYSVQALRAQRHPGQAVGEEIVAALDRLLERKNQEAAQQAVQKQKPA